MKFDAVELCFWLNEESHVISLSEIQSEIIIKILGIEYENINNDLVETKYFSDETLIQLTKIKSNPFNLEYTDKKEKDID